MPVNRTKQDRGLVLCRMMNFSADADGCVISPTIVSERNTLDDRYQAVNALTDGVSDECTHTDASTTCNFWVSKPRMQGSFVIDLGCKARVTRAQFANSGYKTTIIYSMLYFMEISTFLGPES